MTEPTPSYDIVVVLPENPRDYKTRIIEIYLSQSNAWLQNKFAFFLVDKPGIRLELPHKGDNADFISPWVIRYTPIYDEEALYTALHDFIKNEICSKGSLFSIKRVMYKLGNSCCGDPVSLLHERWERE